MRSEFACFRILQRLCPVRVVTEVEYFMEDLVVEMNFLQLH